MVLDVSTRWNSTYDMLGSASHYKKAYKCGKSADKHLRMGMIWMIEILLDLYLRFWNHFILPCYKYCTANLFFHEIYGILVLLHETSIDPRSLVGKMAVNMLPKFENIGWTKNLMCCCS